MPFDLYDQSQKYVKWQDQQTFILGKLLLLQCLANAGYGKITLDKLKYNQYGKPFLDDDIDFNISHSGNFVFCALGEKVKLGIDVEMISDIEFVDFHEVMTQKQWLIINNSENPIESFFRLWTIKESIIKAEGKGFSISPLNVLVNNKIANYQRNIWYLKELYLNSKICICLATNIRDFKLNFVEMEFTSGIKELNLNSPLRERESLLFN